MKSVRLSLQITLAPALAAGVAVALAGAPASMARAAVAAPPRAQLARFACQNGLNPPDRTVSVQTVMRPLPGTRRLGVRFQLLQRAPGSAAQPVAPAGDLGVWIAPANPTLGQLPGDVWRLNKDVINLDAPASYQFRVQFRWLGADGRVLGTLVRLSRSCRERELRPDLTVGPVTVSSLPGRPGRDLYTAVVANAGATGAGPFQVLFTPGDSSGPTIRTVAFLGAHRSVQLSFTGPPCSAASPPTVTADAADQVDDFDRANNVRTAVCPGVSAAPGG